ncbi:MAG: addiction module protein [Acidobacteria bacterium]|nr:addiction module protein [Acidobacteriota bacterium]
MATITIDTETAKILDTAISLPVEMRLAIIDRLLETVQPKQDEIAEIWLKVAERRSEEIRSGLVTPISGEVFLENARKKLGL